MANRLKMATSDTIRTLAEQGWSARRIAKTLGLHRDTVARHLGRGKLGQAPADPAQSKLGQAPVGSDQAKLGQALTGSDPDQPVARTGGAGLPAGVERRQQASLCDPFRATIQDKLDRGLTAQRIYQDLVAEHGFVGRYHSVRRFVRRLEAKQELPFRRLECAPGEEAQVDFGKGAWIYDGAVRAAGRMSSASS
jgi:transposase